MPNTTANFNIPFLDGTELVRDYPQFSKDLANAVDAGLGEAGSLSLINTTNFTNVSSVSLDNVFSAEFRNYKIIWQLTATANNFNSTIRLRAGGVDNSTDSSYRAGLFFVKDNGSTGVSGNPGATSFLFATSSTPLPDITIAELEIGAPFESVRTTLRVSSLGRSGDGTVISFVGGAAHTVQSSFDGFTISGGSSNTGSVSVYGLAK